MSTYKFNSDKTEATAGEKIFFSIIVPTYKRPKQLTACLSSMCQLKYPNEHFEVIVVDDSSDSSLETVITPFKALLNLSVLSQPHAGPATARNRGANHAIGEILVFTDDDCLFAPDWLKNLAAHFATVQDQMIGGKTLNALSDNPYAAASQLLVDYLYSCYNANPNAARFFTSNNFAVPKRIFQKIGGFDTTFPLAAGEDREFCSRWLHHGYSMVYAPEILVYHAHALTFRRFLKQQFNYGLGASHLRWVAAQNNSNSHKIEHPSFYLNLLIYPFHQKGQMPFLLIVLFFLSQVANVTGVLWERLSRNGGNAQDAMMKK